jgi:hypothetical protein
LERGGLAFSDELSQDVGDDLAWERGRVGESAGEGDDVLGAREREDGDETFPRARACPGSEERLPGPHLLLDRHFAVA